MITIPWVRRTLAGLLLVVALGWVGTRPAAAADLITLATDDTRRTLVGPSGDVTFPLELTAAGKAASTVTARPVSVTRGTTSIGVTGVTAVVDPAAAAITVTVDGRTDFGPTGDYAVVLVLLAGDDRQRVTLTVVRPPAVLSAGVTVAVEQVTGWPLSTVWDWDHSDYPDLDLTVDGDGGALATLSGDQVERSAGKVVLTGSRDPKAPPLAGSTVTGRPGTTLGLGYALSGFPLGTTTRTVALTSPQLTAPVVVTFTVTRHLSAWWIVIVTAAGIGMGLLLRVVLGNKIAATQRNRSRLDLRRRIEGLREQYEDAVFESELKGIADALPLDAGQDVLDRQQAAVVTALTEADQRLDQVRGDLQLLADALAGDRTLPTSISSRIDPVLDQLGAARTALEGHRLTSARRAQRAADKAMKGLSEEALHWLDGYRAAVVAADGAIAAAADDPARPEQIRSLRTLLADDSVAAPPDEIKGRLDAVDGAFDRWPAVTRAVRAVVASCRTAQPAAAAQVERALGSPDPSAALHDASGALAVLVTPPPAGQRAVGAPGAGHEQRESARTDEPPAASATTTVLIPAYGLGRAQARAFAAEQAALDRTSTRTTLLTQLAVGVIACAVAYLVGADHWLGTRAQVAAAFGWGYGVDLTVAGAAAFLGARTATPPTYAPAAP